MSSKNYLGKNLKLILPLSFCLLLTFFLNFCSKQNHDALFSKAAVNGKLANEGYQRCLEFVDGWLNEADPQTGLIPRNLTKDKDIWNAHDCGADNYPFMVLTSAIADTALFHGRMRDMLRTETRLSSRLGAIPDVYSFSKKDFLYKDINMARLMFGGSEYIKDGLLPLTEWLGASPWSERMIDILDDMWKNASIETPFGRLISTNVEVNGEMLQVLSRLYWMTSNDAYLDYAIRLGDYYLLGKNHPTRDFEKLRLRDHGCEVVSGLCELYATTHFARPEKKAEYKSSMYEMLDRILEVGRNADGLFYNQVNPQTGDILNEGIADNWGYTFNGYYTLYLIDKIERYKDAVLFGVSHLDNYVNFDWENGSADGYADAIEGGLNLYNREGQPDVADWIDSEIQVMWGMQQESGVIEGWHGDGNFARTTIMYCLWKTQGVTFQPWRADVKLGSVRKDNKIYISIEADQPWEGKLIFDQKRHKSIMNLPLDWPRINQFPEWFTANPESNYKTNIDGKSTIESLSQGLDISIASGETHIIIQD